MQILKINIFELFIGVLNVRGFFKKILQYRYNCCIGRVELPDYFTRGSSIRYT